ncbi:MAG TPA: hypothetical protein VKM55_25880 [Candidatus Lokiarchaeia archaeon]|nr:hypothetical protein [Candidatus Lokiarchaeia archaeon]
MNKQAILIKLNEIEATIKDIREMLEQGSAPEGAEAGVEAGAEGSEEEDSGSAVTRIQCPNCGSLKIISQVDKSKVIYYHQGAPIYAKKGVCGQCGTEIEL